MPRLTGDVFDWDAEPDYEYISPEFANDCARLPVGTPADRAHLIDMDSYDLAEVEEDNEDTRYNVQLWDAVYTMLFKVSTAVLDQFLDSQTFPLVLELDYPTEPKIIVWRQGRQLLVGHYIQYVLDNLLEFDALVRVQINYNGSWKLISATWGKYTKNNLEDAWNEAYVRNSVRDCTVPTEAGCNEHARKLGIEILNPECWDVRSGSKWVVNVT
ncbi:hypothetical protein HBI56_110120 [Parastagonospora nodorum]|nr:hypothetical protein HBH52_142550 [Parastagonospora nodorum]KAH3980783.1 hypothetical protein HBH51_048490 [Parastagonospora nodorum]KAH4004281.1 hypothetical protein HBI10_049460 [Parastagonospora nodorum]KAH4018510.1 hypothetical protein HBI13_133660 [Parastagonospora nodorum]KAH4038626.1 hypothetical protein HBI09_053650 [Parastagonospora nodorum]